MKKQKIILFFLFFFLLLSLFGLSLYSYMQNFLTEKTNIAENHDSGNIGNGVESFGSCEKFISWGASLDKRVMSENESQILSVTILNRSFLEACDGTIAVITPKEIAVSPESPLKVIIPPNTEKTYFWTIEGSSLGDYAILVNFDTDLYQRLGLSVTSVFGLPIWMTQTLSLASGFLGAFFAPILTITWWIDWWKKRKQPAHQPAAKEKQPAHQPATKKSRRKAKR